MTKKLLTFAFLAASLTATAGPEPPPQETLDTIIQNLKNGHNTAAMVLRDRKSVV